MKGNLLVNWIHRKYFFIKNINSGKLLENFLISAVVSIFCIRSFLKITGFPQLGNGSFHIAHMLWGGILMVVSIILLLSFLSNQVKILASVIGGIGFGTFIDELGKFITSDNDYFFQPTIALLYLIFIGLYFLFTIIDKKIRLSKREYLINALEITKEAVIEDLDEVEKNTALELLKKANQEDVIVTSLKKLLEKAETIEPPEPNLYSRLKKNLKKIYHFLIQKKWFRNAVFIFFIIYSFISLFQSAEIIPGLIINFPELNFWETSNLISSIIPSVLILLSLRHIKESFMKFLARMKFAVLFQIFVTQFFLFYFNQFFAIIHLSINVFVLVSLNYMIENNN
ncbi:hypothetical protein GF327_06985 [Candidatus Woesearchaeota archaeon]|nr:hypothetical protein [Candidatus Woesearchaeota archaeon]